MLHCRMTEGDNSGRPHALREIMMIMMMMHVISFIIYTAQIITL